MNLIWTRSVVRCLIHRPMVNNGHNIAYFLLVVFIKKHVTPRTRASHIQTQVPQPMIGCHDSHAKLTHWDRVTHICECKLIIIGSYNGLSPRRRQAIIWTNAENVLIGPLETNFSGILSEIHTFHSRKCILKHLLRSSGHLVSASMCKVSFLSICTTWYNAAQGSFPAEHEMVD